MRSYSNQACVKRLKDYFHGRVLRVLERIAGTEQRLIGLTQPNTMLADTERCHSDENNNLGSGSCTVTVAEFEACQTERVTSFCGGAPQP